MRATEFIAENAHGSLADGVADALPATFVMPELKSQDPYMQYRFGLALASARANAAGETTYDSESKFGENMTVVARSKEEEETLAMALALFGRQNCKELISSQHSKESHDTYTTSPIIQNTRKYRKAE